MTTDVYTYTGGYVDWVVPDQCTSVTIDCKGARGAYYDSAALGGHAVGTFTVVPGNTLRIRVGGAASGPTGGFNGGGDGGLATGVGGYDGRGGGGASDVRLSFDALPSRLIVAAGGGGEGGVNIASRSGSCYGGRGGAAVGERVAVAGFTNTAPGGGGTQSAPGSGGSYSSFASGGDGVGNNGGHGANAAADGVAAGGGGGGGYFGGGGGSAYYLQANSGGFGGGGGSNYIDSIATDAISERGTGPNGHGVVTITYNVVPDQPTLTTPRNSATISNASQQRLGWTFSDPDPGDSQSKADIRYRIAGTSGAWTVVSRVTPNGFYDAPAGTFAPGNYEWQVRTYDALGARGPWSASGFFTAAVPPDGPTITNPSNGDTISTPDITVRFSYPSITAFRYHVYGDDGAGNADPTQVIVAQTNVTTTTGRSFRLSGLANSQTIHIFLAVQTGGLWSGDVESINLVTYTPPPVATATLGVDPDTCSISVAYTVPAATRPAPQAVYVDINVSTDGGATFLRLATQLPTTSVWIFWTPAAAPIDYSFQLVAYASNGAASYTAWLTMPPGLNGDGLYGDGLYGDGPFGGVAA